MWTHNCSTKSKSPRSKNELKMEVSVSGFIFEVFKKKGKEKMQKLGSSHIYSEMNKLVKGLFLLTVSYLSCFYSMIL